MGRGARVDFIGRAPSCSDEDPAVRARSNRPRVPRRNRAVIVGVIAQAGLGARIATGVETEVCQVLSLRVDPADCEQDRGSLDKARERPDGSDDAHQPDATVPRPDLPTCAPRRPPRRPSP